VIPTVWNFYQTRKSLLWTPRIIIKCFPTPRRTSYTPHCVTCLNSMEEVPWAKRIPNPREPRPRIAWPTVILFICSLLLWALSTTLAIRHHLPWTLAVLMNVLASYALFTVTHDAAHRSISRVRYLDEWIGRICNIFLAPQASFLVWRHIHWQHHHFTNDKQGRDPDHYAVWGPPWQLPLRWMTLDIWLLVWYAPQMSRRPCGELIELACTWVAVGIVVWQLTQAGYGYELFVLYLIPLRIVVPLLAWSFDYLPHSGLHALPNENPFKATRNRVGCEWIMSPLFFFQNYHLVHHLHPLIPFYRYVAVWTKNEKMYLKNDPELCSVFGGARSFGTAST